MKTAWSLTVTIVSERETPGADTPLNGEDRLMTERIAAKMEQAPDLQLKMAASFIPILFNEGDGTSKRVETLLQAPPAEEVMREMASRLSAAELQFLFRLYAPPEPESPEDLKRRDACLRYLHAPFKSLWISEVRLETNEKQERHCLFGGGGARCGAAPSGADRDDFDPDARRPPLGNGETDTRHGTSGYMFSPSPGQRG